LIEGCRGPTASVPWCTRIISEIANDVITSNALISKPATKVKYLLHGTRLCRRLLNFAHVSVVHVRHLAIAPGDRDRIPTRFGDNAAISGIAAPINARTPREAL
jgi:hypothetical protein